VSATEQTSRLDPVGLVLIGGLGLVVTPGLIFGTVFYLTRGLHFVGATNFELVAAALSVIVGLLGLKICVRELSGALRLHLDERGLRCGGVTMAWTEVTRLEAPEFGVLVVHAGDRQIRIRTYLFRDRRGLLELVAERTGMSAPEMSVSL